MFESYGTYNRLQTETRESFCLLLFSPESYAAFCLFVFASYLFFKKGNLHAAAVGCGHCTLPIIVSVARYQRRNHHRYGHIRILQIIVIIIVTIVTTTTTTTTTFIISTHGLTFTWWGCYGLCQT